MQLAVNDARVSFKSSRPKIEQAVRREYCEQAPGSLLHPGGPPREK